MFVFFPGKWGVLHVLLRTACAFIFRISRYKGLTEIAEIQAAKT